MKGRKNMKSKNLQVAKANKGKLMLLSECALCNSKNSKFAKTQEPSRLLSRSWFKKLEVKSFY